MEPHAARALRIEKLANEIFGEKEKAARWLRQPLSLLGGASPLDLAETQAGYIAVENILARIAWGAAA
ncbi:MAG: DUF2384 domain-containing protein [Hyphomicrobiales bacterium]|nr:DUF2384 domain-containing protein [Hyphomicrobiales bacterium]